MNNGSAVGQIPPHTLAPFPVYPPDVLCRQQRAALDGCHAHQASWAARLQLGGEQAHGMQGRVAAPWPAVVCTSLRACYLPPPKLQGTTAATVLHVRPELGTTSGEERAGGVPGRGLHGRREVGSSSDLNTYTI